MIAFILNGKKISKLFLPSIIKSVRTIKRKITKSIGLAVILIGENPASKIYVNNKRKFCIKVGINFYQFNHSKNISEQSLLKLITKLNKSDYINGILVQLPLPNKINIYNIIESIHPYKDVDGFHPYNMGRLAQKNPLLRPCTSMGIINLLKYYNIPIKRKHVIIIGESIIVGRPMALEFLYFGATVTICHDLTLNLKNYVKQADILIIATGIQDLISIDWLHSKQIIIDVGIHKLSNGSLRGDINFDKAKYKVSYITPVPGGVGPMTIISLLQNTILATQLYHNL